MINNDEGNIIRIESSYTVLIINEYFPPSFQTELFYYCQL